jgi:hypothetical protein
MEYDFHKGASVPGKQKTLAQGENVRGALEKAKSKKDRFQRILPAPVFATEYNVHITGDI